MVDRKSSLGSIDVRAADALPSGFIIGVSIALFIVPGHVPSWRGLILNNVLAIATFFGALWLTTRWDHFSLRWFLRTAAVLLLTSFIFNEMGKIIHIFFSGWFDNLVMKWELAAFGVHPTVWLQQYTVPAVTELVMFAYVVYVPMIPYVAWLSNRKGGEKELESYLTTVVLASLVCYVGFVLFPVACPVRMIGDLHTVPLEGYFFTWITELMRENVHFPGGCLPSPHVAVSTVMILTMRKHSRLIFWLFLPLVLMIYISTVYGRFHYLSDGIAGLLVGFLAAWAGPRINSWWDKVTLLVQVKEHSLESVELEEVYGERP